MKNLILIFLPLLFLNVVFAQAQEPTFEEKVKLLSERVEEITAQERSILKDKIKLINKRQNRNDISENEAQQLKKEAAEETARIIQGKIAEVEKKLQVLIQQKVDNEIFTESNRKRFRIGSFDVDYERLVKNHEKKYKRTSTS